MQLNLSPYILESLVLAAGRKRGGEELAAILVPDKSFLEAERARRRELDVNAELASVIEHYNQSVPAYRRIRQWRVQEGELEKTSTRKVRRYVYGSAAPPPQR